MSDDLVKELRSEVMIYNRGPDYEPLIAKPSPLMLKAADAIERLTRERDEARAYLKAFVYATIDPGDKRHDAQLHKANPSLGWVFMLEHEHVCKSRSVLSSQVRRAMEIVGYDKLKIEPPGTTVADDLVEANRAKRAAEARIAKLEADNADLLVLWESDECFVNGGRVIANFSHYGADAEEVPDAEIGVVADLVRRFGDEAVVSWICHKRGLDNPIKGNFTEKQRAANDFLRARAALEDR